MAKFDDDGLCQKCGLAMGELLDGVEDSTFHQKIRRRVESNPVCRACFDSYKKTAELCRHALSTPVPDAVGDRLATFLRRECGAPETDD